MLLYLDEDISGGTVQVRKGVHYVQRYNDTLCQEEGKDCHGR